MTTTSVGRARPTDDREAPSALTELKAAVRAAAAAAGVALIDRAARTVRHKIDDLAGTLDDVKASGGVPVAAAIGGGLAAAAGRNPVLGAIKGGFGALTVPMRIGLLLALLVLLLLAPVLAVVVLLVLLIAAVVTGIRAGGS